MINAFKIKGEMTQNVNSEQWARHLEEVGGGRRVWDSHFSCLKRCVTGRPVRESSTGSQISDAKWDVRSAELFVSRTLRGSGTCTR